MYPPPSSARSGVALASAEKAFVAWFDPKGVASMRRELDPYPVSRLAGRGDE